MSREQEQGQGARREVIVLLEDDPFIAEVMAGHLRQDGYQVIHFAEGSKLLDQFPEQTAAVCLDLGLADMPGLHVLQHLQARHHDVPVVVVTAQRDIEIAISMMRMGAYNYLVKPVPPAQLREAVREACARHAQIRQVSSSRGATGEMVGQSSTFLGLLRQIERLANSSATVCLLGESGTGKELLASAIHARGRRSKGPFVALNCGAIPASLLESELFGYEKGAFTGAFGVGRGCFERAHGGTLFLDEIGEMSLAGQVGLLRVLQEKKVRRLGGGQEIPVDVRVVCATHRDLGALVKAGQFRDDLYFRLNVFPLHVPALRERVDDISLLVGHFLVLLSTDLDGQQFSVSEAALKALACYEWPGNIRQLKNVIHRAMLVADGGVIDLCHLPDEIREGALPEIPVSQRGPVLALAMAPGEDGVIPLKELEHRAFEQALQKTNGNISQAAKLLKIGRATLYRRLQELRGPKEGT